MPMELPYCALGEMLLRGRDVVALGQVLDDLLAEPSSLEEPRFGVGEPPLQVWDNSGICRLLAQVVRVSNIDLPVCSSWGR